MTENEAIKVLEKPSKHIRMVHKTKNEMEFYTFSSDLVKAFEMAIQALEEMQKIKALGDCYIIPKNSTWEVNGIDIHKALEDIQQYRAIGTIEEFKALKENNEPKKPILNNPNINEFYVKEAKLCPACHSYINNWSGDYCRDCGQKLDWSE